MRHPNVYKRDDLPRLFGVTGAEIGTQRGNYALVICKANPKIHLYCIDSWEKYKGYRAQSTPIQEEYFAEARSNLSEYNVSFIHKLSMDAVRDFEDASLDFVYIDANHEFDYVMQDIIEWSKKVKKGGIVAGHDYYEFPSGRGGIIQAVNSYAYAHQIYPIYFTQDKEPTWFWIKK